jgi:tetratricopeptide (TPR) repeat protein
MSKFLAFGILFWLFGNPLVAILVLLLILYVLDRRYVGLSPSLFKPLKRRNRIGKLKQQLGTNPHDVPAKMELARLLIGRSAYREARQWLEPLQETMNHSAEFWDDLGTCWLHTSELARGEAAIRKALELNPRVKYGEPHLRLASLYAEETDKTRAIEALQTYQGVHSSSCESYYRLGQLYEQLGRKEEAKEVWNQAVAIYRSLPRYKKREERKWVLKSMLKRAIVGANPGRQV